jgi:hypothetical protein
MNRSVIAVLFLIAGLLLIPVGSTPAQTYWDAIFEIGFDSMNQRVNPVLARDRLDRIFRLNSLVTDHLIINEKLGSKVQNMQSRTTSMDAKDLYDDMPHAVAGSQWQSLGIRGTSNPDSYQLDLTKPEITKRVSSSTRVQTGTSDHQHRFGDMDIRTSIRPTEKNAFRFVTHGQLYLDDLPADNLARVLNGMLKTLWVQASNDMDPPLDFFENSALNQQSKKVLYGIATEFPNLCGLLRQYVDIDAVIPTNLEPIAEDVMFDLKGRLNRDALVTDYPEMAKLLHMFEGMASIRSRVFDVHNGRLLTLQIDFQRNLANIQFRTFNGRLFPMRSTRESEAYSGFRLIDTKATRFKVISDIHISMVGLHFDIEGLQMAIEYANGEDGLRLKASMKQSPRAVVISGRVLGVFPVWLVDLLIPSNVEEITVNFLETLAKSNGGQGAEVELGSPPPLPSNNSLWLRADAEIVSNGTLKLGSHFQRAMAVDLQKFLSQASAFRKRLWHAFYQDYRSRYAHADRSCRQRMDGTSPVRPTAGLLHHQNPDTEICRGSGRPAIRPG